MTTPARSRTGGSPRVRPPGAPLTVAQAAQAAQISETTIRALCASGRLRHHRIGAGGRGAIRIDEEDFRAWWESTRAEPEAQAAAVRVEKDYFA